MIPPKRAEEMTRDSLASYIDQSVLKPEFTQGEIRRYIQEGIDFKCKTVCVNPSSLPVARELCRGKETGICVVCDFPFGQSSTESKVAQAEFILKDGGVEDLDAVLNYGWMRSGLWDRTGAEIEALARCCRAHGAILKVILETGALTMEETARAVETACTAGAGFVKTSTGFFSGGNPRGASPDVIAVMMEAAKGRCKVKGAGGIRTQEHFFQLINMGIDRMGIGYKSTPVVLGAGALD
ncbi:MAG: deoxyribose-phosphate aldolase [Treponema sp.]|jgi:deoxyribose-phosphate aldolase|nr:deoxyribose-phosphate aldolase [Treponema sp.]